MYARPMWRLQYQLVLIVGFEHAWAVFNSSTQGAWSLSHHNLVRLQNWRSNPIRHTELTETIGEKGVDHVHIYI